MLPIYALCLMFGVVATQASALPAHSPRVPIVSEGNLADSFYDEPQALVGSRRPSLGSSAPSEFLLSIGRMPDESEKIINSYMNEVSSRMPSGNSALLLPLGSSRSTSGGSGGGGMMFRSRKNSGASMGTSSGGSSTYSGSSAGSINRSFGKQNAFSSSNSVNTPHYRFQDTRYPLGGNHGSSAGSHFTASPEKAFKKMRLLLGGKTQRGSPKVVELSSGTLQTSGIQDREQPQR